VRARHAGGAWNGEKAPLWKGSYADEKNMLY